MLLAHMKPALLARATVRPEDSFERKRRRSCQWMIVDEQRILHTVELDRLANRRIDDLGRSKNGGLVSTDMIEPVKQPHNRIVRQRAQVGDKIFEVVFGKRR